MAQMPPWLANKKPRKMHLSITTHANELQLICIPSRAEMVSLKNSALVSNKFLIVFSLCMILTTGDPAWAMNQ